MTRRQEHQAPRTGPALRLGDRVVDGTRRHLAAALRPADPRRLRQMEQAEQHRPGGPRLIILAVATARAQRLHRDMRGALAYARRLLRSAHRQVRDLGRDLLGHARALAATIARHILRPLRRALTPCDPSSSTRRPPYALAPPAPVDPLDRARQLVVAPGAPNARPGRFARAA